MKLYDINVLIYAFRKDSEHHAVCREMLEDAVASPSPFALTGHVLSGFLRIVTDRRVFAKDPTPVRAALGFTRALQACPNMVFLAPGQKHWGIVELLCERMQVSGADVSDAYLAAVAIENGCELVTFDRDYARFPGLTWRHPREDRPQTNPGSA